MLSNTTNEMMDSAVNLDRLSLYQQSDPILPDRQIEITKEAESLCETCRLIDLHALFHDNNYKPPKLPLQLHPEWLYLSIRAMRREKRCRLCCFLLEFIDFGKPPRESDEGILVAKVSRMFDVADNSTLENIHFLELSVKSDDLLSEEACGYGVGVVGSHRLILPPKDEDVIHHLFGLPYGMYPMVTDPQLAKELQGKAEDVKRRLSKEYSVVIRTLDPSEVDIGLVRKWLATCEQEHTEWCSNAPHSNPNIPGFRVIDVRAGCVVHAPIDCRYLALSYVWGKVDHLRLTESTYAKLTTKGGLFKNYSLLPASINDSIRFCQMLEESYLWIDSLCIIQDSMEDRKAQIGNMDVIYNGAILTIVAAAGSNANAGLPGIGSASHRGDKLPTLKIQGLDLTALHWSGVSDTVAAVWNSRGWTFQEKILSKRILRVGKNLVTFECLQASWREDIDVTGPDCERIHLDGQDGPDHAVQVNFHQMLHHQKVEVPDFANRRLIFDEMKSDIRFSRVFGEVTEGKYYPLVSDYTSRQLTYDGDILQAFEGLQKPLSRSLGPFLWGHPKHVLPMTLIWHARSSHLERRSGFPSWSWAGWKFTDSNRVCYSDSIDGPSPTFSQLEYNAGDWDSVPISDDRFCSYWGIYTWHDKLLFAAADEDDHYSILSDLRSGSTNTPPSHLLLFFTSAKRITKSTLIIPEDDDRNDWKNRILRGTSLMRLEEVGGAGQLGLILDDSLSDQEMKALQSEIESGMHLELIYLGSSLKNSSSPWTLILVTWMRGIAYRIHPEWVFYIRPSDWEDVGPERRFVALG